MVVCTKTLPIGSSFAPMCGFEATLASMLVAGQLETCNLEYSLDSSKTVRVILNTSRFGLWSNHE